MTERELLARTAEIAADYVESLDTRPVAPASSYREMHAVLDAPVPDGPSEPITVVEEMVRLLDPGITAMGSGRFFGFVIGGALPASVAADWLVSTWDQNSCLAEPTPATTALETVAGRWVLELLGLPERSSFAFGRAVRWLTSRASPPLVTPSMRDRAGISPRAAWPERRPCG